MSTVPGPGSTPASSSLNPPVLVVRPLASGGLAAHVDQELAVLAAAGQPVQESRAGIGPRPHPVQDLRTLRLLRQEIARHRPRAVHAHGLRAGALAVLANLSRRRATAPRLVVTLHNRTLGSAMVRVIGAVLLCIVAHGADTVLCVSPDLLDAARRAGARDARHAVIPAPQHPVPQESASQDPVSQHPVPEGSARTGPRAAEDGAAPEALGDLDVLVLARLAPQKGLEHLLDAAALLADAPGVRVRIAGEGPLRPRLEARIRQERLPVQLLGHRSDVPQLLDSADLVVSAAVWEGQPVALQEALRAGRAIVATDAGGTSWVTGTAAQLVPVGDAAALADAIARHHDPAVRRRAQEASLRRAAELPTERDLTHQLLDVLAPGRPAR